MDKKINKNHLLEDLLVFSEFDYMWRGIRGAHSDEGSISISREDCSASVLVRIRIGTKKSKIVLDKFG